MRAAFITSVIIPHIYDHMSFLRCREAWQCLISEYEIIPIITAEADGCERILTTRVLQKPLLNGLSDVSQG